MIIARAPFRITLGGGGTDLPSFYRGRGGFIFAMAIDKYVNVILNPTVIDRRIRLQYLQSEVVEHVSQLRHPLAREALRLHGIERAMEITSIADLPARAGVGSSGSYLVAFLTALHAYGRRPATSAEIAEEACHIEIDLLGEPVGKQDQYMASFGGLRTLEIAPDGRVRVASVGLSPAALSDLISNMHVYYTGVERSASEILSDQNRAAGGDGHRQHGEVIASLERIRELGYWSLEAIGSGNFDEFGRLMDLHWQAKKRMSPKIALSAADALYEQVKAEYGVLGGKIIGAGGGGFLMLYCPARHRQLAEFMARSGLRQLAYSIEFQGAKVLADLRSSHEFVVTHGSEPCESSWPAEPVSSEATLSNAC
jgi:D-glycero-alpha-D-manno-heptose-7-phosphate kinase